jgi:WD40 repeat protein
MSSLADLPELVGFFSYSRDDDEDSNGALSGLRDRIQRELRGQLGRSVKTFRLWQDKQAIAAGKLWETEIKTAIAQSVFFIPIITPTVVKSPHCRFELEAFLSREASLGRNDLLFPILYIKVPQLEDEGHRRNEAVLSIIGSRQYVDWREFRHRDLGSTEVKQAIERFCANICGALQHPWHMPVQQKDDARASEAAIAEPAPIRTPSALEASPEPSQTPPTPSTLSPPTRRAVLIGGGGLAAGGLALWLASVRRDTVPLAAPDRASIPAEPKQAAAPPQGATAPEPERPSVPEAPPAAKTPFSLLREFVGHTDSVYAIAFAPDGRTVASGSYDRTIKLWDVADGRTLLTLSGHARTVNCVAFAPGGTTLLSGASDNIMKLWDIKSGKEIRSFAGHSSDINCIAVSPDGRTVLSGSEDNTARTWEVSTGRRLRTFGRPDQDTPVESVAFAPEGSSFAMARGDVVSLFDAASGRELRSFSHRGARTVAFVRDGRALLSGGEDGALRLWDVSSGRELRILADLKETPPPIITSTVFMPDGLSVMGGSSERLRIWSLASGALLHALEEDSRRLAVAPDGGAVLVAAGNRTFKLLGLTR